MGEPGTPDERPAGWGKALSKDWWYKTAQAILIRLVGFPAGEGPPDDQAQRLADGLQIIFNAKEGADLGEREVRGFLGGTDDPSDQLQIALGDKLVERCGPLLTRQIAQSVSSGISGGKPPSAAVAPSRRDPAGAGVPPAGATVRRPKPRGQPPFWWQRWIDAQDDRFETELAKRVSIYESCLEVLSPWNIPQFTKLPEVQVNEEYWRKLYKDALNVSKMSIGIPGADSDDAYHVPDLNLVRGSLQSFWLLGELVHAQWQFEYMDAEIHNDVIAEYLFSAGLSPHNVGRNRGEFEDWRYKSPKDPEEVSDLGALLWAYGDPRDTQDKPWRPDIIDLSKRRVFEIKPLRTAHLGVLQLWRYVHNFNCALMFDWLEKPGGQGKDKPIPLSLEKPSGDCFREVDPTEFLKAYFAESDRKPDSGGASKGRIPRARQRAKRGDVEREIRRGGKIKVLPVPAFAIPGLVLYVVLRDPKAPRKPPDPAEPVVTPVVLVVTGLLIIAAVLVGVVVVAALAQGAATAAAPVLAEGGAAAAAPVLAEGGGAAAAPVVEVFGVPMTEELAPAALGRVSGTLSELSLAEKL